MHSITKYHHLGIITGLALCLFGTIQQAEARRIVDTMGERCAPVTLQAGQNARVTVSNVLVPTNGSKPADCPVLVRFFDAGGTLLGSEKEANLKAGASTSISAESLRRGLCALSSASRASLIRKASAPSKPHLKCSTPAPARRKLPSPARTALAMVRAAHLWPHRSQLEQGSKILR
jgi:hypothetical protein